MEPMYIVFVMPPKGVDAEQFDIPEWEYNAAMATAKRYRERGWHACIIDYGMPFVLWHAWRTDGQMIDVMARTCAEACTRADAISADCDKFQSED